MISEINVNESLVNMVQSVLDKFIENQCYACCKLKKSGILLGIYGWQHQIADELEYHASRKFQNQINIRFIRWQNTTTLTDANTV